MPDLVKAFLPAIAPDGLGARVQEHLPKVWSELLGAVNTLVGAKRDHATGIVLFTATRADGTPIPMVRVHEVNDFGDLGDELGTVDVGKAMATLPWDDLADVLGSVMENPPPPITPTDTPQLPPAQ